MPKNGITICRITTSRKVVSSLRIPVRTLFDGKIGDQRAVFVRTCDSVVSLSDPTYTWPVHEKLLVDEYAELEGELTVRPRQQD